MNYLVPFAVWVFLGIAAAGLFNAQLRADFPKEDARRTRQDCGFALALGLIGGPASFVVAIVVTGIGSAGWSLECKPVTYTT